MTKGQVNCTCSYYDLRIRIRVYFPPRITCYCFSEPLLTISSDRACPWFHHFSPLIYVKISGVKADPQIRLERWNLRIIIENRIYKLWTYRLLLVDAIYPNRRLDRISSNGWPHLDAERNTESSPSQFLIAAPRRPRYGELIVEQ